MEPLQFVRLIRRRWIVLMLCTAIGAAIGYASTLGDDEVTGPVQSYWAGAEQLQLSSVTADTRLLNRIAPDIVRGDLPAIVAEQIGIPLADFEPTIYTVTDTTAGTIDIWVVALSAQDAQSRSLLLATAVLDSRVVDNEAAFQLELDRLRGEADELGQRLVEIDAAIDAERARLGIADPDDELAETVDDTELRALQISRDIDFERLVELQRSITDLERAGPAAVDLTSNGPIGPIPISQRSYGARIALGQQGEQTFGPNSGRLIEADAGVAAESSFDKPPVRATAGAVAGFLLGLLAILIHWRLDPKLRDREETEAAFGLPVITEVPLMGRRDVRKGVLHAKDRPRSFVSEAHRYLRSVLLYASATGDVASEATAPGAHSAPETTSPEREVRVVMVTSPGSGEGKTTTSANLAVVMAEAGYKTLLFNCDHRLPSVHKLLGVEYIPGKTQPVPGVPGLTFVADVPKVDQESPAEIARRQVRVLEKARKTFDVVIVDTAPLMATNDAIDLLSSTDLIVLVAREAKTTAAAATDTRELIDRIGTPIAGVVITCSGAGMGSRYYDSYRYGSYYGERSRAQRKADKKAAKAAKETSHKPFTPEELGAFDVGNLHVNGNGNGHAPINGTAPYVPRNGQVQPGVHGPEIDIRQHQQAPQPDR